MNPLDSLEIEVRDRGEYACGKHLILKCSTSSLTCVVGSCASICVWRKRQTIWREKNVCLWLHIWLPVIFSLFLSFPFNSKHPFMTQSFTDNFTHTNSLAIGFAFLRPYRSQFFNFTLPFDHGFYKDYQHVYITLICKYFGVVLNISSNEGRKKCVYDRIRSLWLDEFMIDCFISQTGLS